MNNQVAIFTPTSYRAHNINRLITSIRETSDARMYFIFPNNDKDTWHEVSKMYEPHRKDLFWWTDDPAGDTRFSKRIQSMYKETDENWFLTGADDVIFQPGWLNEAQQYMADYSVIGFEDLCNPTLPGTNFLINREYIEQYSGVVDIPNVVFYDGYFHNFVDNELVGVARSRGEFIKCEGVIEHDHPMRRNWEGMDMIYNIAKDHWDEDASLYNSRSVMW